MKNCKMLQILLGGIALGLALTAATVSLKQFGVKLIK